MENKVLGTKVTGFNARYMSGHFGRSLKLGAMDSFGWNIEGFGKNARNHGFLGQRKWADSFKGITRSSSGAITQAAVAGGVKGSLRVAGTAAMSSIGLLSTAYFAYTGYQQEGAWGAVKGMAESTAYSAGFHYAIGAVAGTAALPLTIAAAIAAVGVQGTYALGEAGISHAKGLRQLEMGQSDQMQAAVGSAGAATMRQRSLMALNNTHLNGRMALGNEGYLMHRSFV